MKLDDMTKDELIQLIKSNPYQPKERDLLRIRWNALCDKASKLREQSIALNQSRSNFDPARFIRSCDLWDEAERVEKKAQAVYAEMMGEKVAS